MSFLDRIIILNRVLFSTSALCVAVSVTYYFLGDNWSAVMVIFAGCAGFMYSDVISDCIDELQCMAEMDRLNRVRVDVEPRRRGRVC